MLKYRQLYMNLKAHILEGRYSMDEPLPSVRRLSQELSISRTTVENAYGQLLLEGYVYSVHGVGYFVNGLEKMLPSVQMETSSLPTETGVKKYIYDYRNEYVSGKVFDLSQWQKHIQAVIRNEKEHLYKTHDALGELALRKAISNYIGVARSIYIPPQMIYIGAGIQTLLMKLIPVIHKKVDGFVIEDPGFKKVSHIFLQNNIPILPIPLKKETLDLDSLIKLKHKICYVSPAHQYPTGQVMKVEERYELLDWAKKTDSYIIEDDFNAELRYELFPVPALKSMDSYDRVIYLGSFSTYLMPSIRISYMILPEELRAEFLSHAYSQTAGTLEQLAFARMIESGDFSRQVNRLRKHYAKKSDLLIKSIANHLEDRVAIYKNYSGYNILLGLGENQEEETIVRQAALEGLGLMGINEHIYSKRQPPTIMLNYRGIDEDLIEESIEALGKVIKQQTSPIIAP